MAEAWGSDAVSVLGNLAAATERIGLGSGVLQLGTRTPATIALTAITLSELSEGRFLLGLGSSGPQVIEGLHGVPFAHPLARMRETLDVIRSIFAGEKIAYSGRHITIPRPGGTRSRCGPRSPRATRSRSIWRHCRQRCSSSPANSPTVGSVGASDIVEESRLAEILASRKKELAFSLGGMGSASTNYYNAAYLVLATTLIGTPDHIRRRLATWDALGIDLVRLYPAGADVDAKIANLAEAIEFVRDINRAHAQADR